MLAYWINCWPIGKLIRPALALLLVAIVALDGHAQERSKFEYHYSDHLEVIPSRDRQTWYAVGAVVFETDMGWIYCDSAIWVKGERVKLKGSVIIDDTDYHLAADSVDYDLKTEEAVARGAYVELWSRDDSVFAVGTHAYHDRTTDFFYMEDRPTLYLNYPDTASMIEVVADFVYYDGQASRTEASGDVKISSSELSSTSGCAVMYPERKVLDLFDNPVALREKSELSGKLISMTSVDGIISSIDIIDSARGVFNEPVDSTGDRYDRSVLSGKRILFDFEQGELERITCYSQAYSWYYPHDVPGAESRENEVSGDTIVFDVHEEKLLRVSVAGGAIGTYLSRKTTLSDTLVDTIIDTVDYNAQRLTYDLIDSTISLTDQAHVTSGEVVLDAYIIEIDTKSDVVTAYSADIASDSAAATATLTSGLQPNPIPVVLKDRNDVLFGDYLEYSIETEKGRIVQSKSKYQTGYFYGNKLYRQHKDVFYLREGRYTTCDADEPHFHFHSSNLKLMENEKLFAKPVVLYIGRIPILAIPYYIFPLKRGRHSGWLPFTFGNIERGERYVRNVGYYWAASDYWDWQGALDYIENRNSLNFYSRVNYNKRYAFNGSLSGNYARETSFNATSATETKGTRWTLAASHNHEFSPAFKINATGNIQSDASYYQDFSSNLQERLNRVIRSQVNFTKRFSPSVSLSGKIVHDENLDTESRTDQLPNLGITLPTLRPFGSGKVNEEGKVELRWYNNLVATYRPGLFNYSLRNTRSITYDTTIVIDTLTMIPDTTILIDTVAFSAGDEWPTFRSRKKYTRVNHNLTLSFPTRIARYIVFNPSFSYAEEWFNIYRTDQSDAAGIDASTTYRAYTYNTGASLSTSVYGTVYPNLFGLTGFRQVITPTVSYRFTPEINRHPDVRKYAGGAAGSTRRSQSMSFSLNQVYQAKVKKGEAERNLNLVSLTSGFSYDLEKDSLQFSDLSTSFQSTVLPKINFYGSMVHSLYEPGTDNLDLWSPTRTSFSFNASVTLAGSRSIFDDVAPGPWDGTDSAQTAGDKSPVGGRKGWNLTANYSYRESGLDRFFTKSSFLRFSLRFNLTPMTSISYSQYYNITDGKTINNQVNIVRQLHCWTGNFFWVPVGSNRGWGFKLYVTAMPEIKIDQSQSVSSSGFFERFR